MAKVNKSQYRKDLEARVKPMLQEANMKLLNLERLAKDPQFAGIEQFAYRQAMQAIKEIRGAEYKRFNMPKNIHKLEKTERELEKFLSRPTSSKKGVLELYEKNAEALNERFGSRFSWQKMGAFLQAAEFEDMKEKFESKTAMIAMKQIYKHRRTGKKKFIQMLEKHEISDLDEVDSDVLADFIKTNIKWTDLR
jgi:hypothetical protein